MISNLPPVLVRKKSIWDIIFISMEYVIENSRKQYSKQG